MPPVIQAYLDLARIRQPIGFLLLMWPCWWAVALADTESISSALWLYFLFFAGSFVMRVAGCAWNDILDRDIDAQVARTRNRPVASGRLTVKQAIGFMTAMALVGLLILVQLNGLAIVVGLAALPLVAAYPLMKRITWWPQAWLGLTFNWGALVGWAAVTGTLESPALALYVAGVAWTLGYDTIYAHQDKLDDALVGVKSSALRLGGNSRKAIFIFYGITIVGLAAAMVLANASPWAYALLPLAAAQLAWQALTVDIDDPSNCLVRFKSNSLFAGLFFVACLIS